MRAFLILTVLIAAFLAIDAFAFGGRYRTTAWQYANYQGKKFINEVHYYLEKHSR